MFQEPRWGQKSMKLLKTSTQSWRGSESNSKFLCSSVPTANNCSPPPQTAVLFVVNWFVPPLTALAAKTVLREQILQTNFQTFHVAAVGFIDSCNWEQRSGEAKDCAWHTLLVTSRRWRDQPCVHWTPFMITNVKDGGAPQTVYSSCWVWTVAAIHFACLFVNSILWGPVYSPAIPPLADTSLRGIQTIPTGCVVGGSALLGFSLLWNLLFKVLIAASEVETTPG